MILASEVTHMSADTMFQAPTANGTTLGRKGPFARTSRHYKFHGRIRLDGSTESNPNMADWAKSSAAVIADVGLALPEAVALEVTFVTDRPRRMYGIREALALLVTSS
jgi:hypothetical protein